MAQANNKQNEPMIEPQSGDILQLVNRLVQVEVENALLKEQAKQIPTKEDLEPLYKALVAAQAEFNAPKKNRKVNVKSKTGRDYTFEYADLKSLRDAIVPILNKHGIFFSQHETWNGSNLVAIETILRHESGVSIQQVDAPLIYDVNNGQKARSTTTYLRRYSLSNLFGIAAEDDDDNNIASENGFSYLENEPEQEDDIQGNFQNQGLQSNTQNQNFNQPQNRGNRNFANQAQNPRNFGNNFNGNNDQSGQNLPL
ncbi:TPA: ERF family protein [Streptococcus agalactiae]|nr:ERF family protein [Streptococcus agalactiae]